MLVLANLLATYDSLALVSFIKPSEYSTTLFNTFIASLEFIFIRYKTDHLPFLEKFYIQKNYERGQTGIPGTSAGAF